MDTEVVGMEPKQVKTGNFGRAIRVVGRTFISGLSSADQQRRLSETKLLSGAVYGVVLIFSLQLRYFHAPPIKVWQSFSA